MAAHAAVLARFRTAAADLEIAHEAADVFARVRDTVAKEQQLFGIGAAGWLGVRR
jgi:hypothetical protein